LWLNDFFGSALFAAFAVPIMLSIDARITILAFAPLLVIVLLANAATARIEGYRRAMRKASAIVVGFIAETFGAVQAVKVANAEGRVIDYFSGLNEQRRQAALKDRLFNEILRSIFHNASNVGVGVILIVAAHSLNAGDFTVGDFSLFVSYQGFISEFVVFAGFMVARYRQAGVSVSRMVRLLQGEPPERLVEPGPIYMDEPMPAIPYTERTATDYLQQLEVKDLTFHHTESGRGIEQVNLKLNRCRYAGSRRSWASRSSAGR
jgi:ATP-binding cassette subfamily B protein